MPPARKDQAKWQKQYNKLASYFKENGHSRVPRDHELSEWVQHQRSDRRKGVLSEDRIAKLDQLDLRWGSEAKGSNKEKKATGKDDNFDEMYQQLQAFFKEKGHTRAPLTSNLGVWCQKQRTKLRDDSISPEHRARLEEIGFDYQIQSQKHTPSGGGSGNGWDCRCRQLAAFYQENGHFVIPRRHDLFVWVADQRKAYKDGRLKKEQRFKLDAVHFQWTEAAAVESQKSWDMNYEKLKRFKQRRGHSFVQRDDDIQLWRWTEKNDWKQRRGTLPRKRYEQLASLGFWDPPPENLSERGDSNNQDTVDVAFVMGNSSDDGIANKASNRGESDGEVEAEASDDEEKGDDEGWTEDDSSNEDNQEEEEGDGDEVAVTKQEKKGYEKSQGCFSSRSKGQNEGEMPRKRLRRTSTFDDDAFSTRYQVGTKVMKYFDKHGWFQGEIISIYEQNIYKIRYEDEDEETYLIPNEQEELDQIVANTDILRHEVGTKVKKMFKGHGWFEGEVVSRGKDRYRIRYEDGDKEDYLFDSEMKALDEIVANARSQ